MIPGQHEICETPTVPVEPTRFIHGTIKLGPLTASELFETPRATSSWFIPSTDEILREVL